MEDERIGADATRDTAEAGGTSHPHSGPSPIRVPSRGVPARLAAVAVVGAFAIVVGVGISGQGDGGRPGSSGALAEPSPTAVRSWPAATTMVGGPLPEEHCVQVLPTGESPLPDIAEAVPGDDASDPLPLGMINDVPNADRLDFLSDAGGCFRDAHWLDPLDPTMGSGVWTAGRPFHVREGFINNGTNALGDGFDVVLYVTRLEADRAEPTYRYTSDYVLRGPSARCGPTYLTDGSPQTCEWFVHDFPEGLPEGRHAIWAAWEAPCWAWVDLRLADSCVDPGAMISLFASGFDAPYRLSGPEYELVSF